MRIGEIAGRDVWLIAKGYAPDEGGMQAYAEGVAEAYAEAGARVTVFTQTSIGPRRERCGPVDLIDVGPGKGFGIVLGLYCALRREMRKVRSPVFVHGTTWRTSVLPMICGLPFVTTFHGREFMYAGGVAARVMRAVARRATAIVTVSHYSARKLAQRLGKGSARATVAWNGVTRGMLADETQPPQAPHAPLLLFSLCRLEPRKNIRACIRACARLRDEGYVFRYIIAGRGPDLQAVRDDVRKAGLEAMVEVAGFVPADRALALYHQADVFLHPQIEIDGGRDFEGFGIAIADAMAARTAPVIGREGGAVELIEQGISGIAVDGRDDDALFNALAGLLDDPAATREMADQAHIRAKSLFTWQRHVRQILGCADGSK